MARLVSSNASFLLGAVSAKITPRANILTCIAKLQRKGIKHKRFTTTKIQTRYFTGLAKIHSQSQFISSADTMRAEMPIDTYIQPNKEDDRITVEIHLNGMENDLSDDQRKWIESLEVIKTKVSFLSKMSPGSYPPVFCVIKVPKSLYAVEAVMLKKSNVTITNNLSESMTVTTQGGNCALKNNQTRFVSVKTENGDCKIDNSESGAWILMNCKGNETTIETTSGNVFIHNTVSTIQRVSTDSGDCVLSNNKCTSMIINTNSGNCHLRDNWTNTLDATSQTGTCVCVGNVARVFRFLHGGGCRSNKGKPNVDD